MAVLRPALLLLYFMGSLIPACRATSASHHSSAAVDAPQHGSDAAWKVVPTLGPRSARRLHWCFVAPTPTVNVSVGGTATQKSLPVCRCVFSSANKTTAAAAAAAAAAKLKGVPQKQGKAAAASDVLGSACGTEAAAAKQAATYAAREWGAAVPLHAQSAGKAAESSPGLTAPVGSSAHP